ncbi:VOC family protein [Sphingomonas limnosediminicola]|uniref:VOC family protein n=1 Tax=Sphingomonas limnosediminicola TaxID=940133 RepID=A0ABP7KVR3_9SPHN
MINIESADHVVLRVLDVEKVGAFYIDVLGGRWDRRRDDIGLHHLRLGNMMIDLVPVDGQLGRTGGAAPGSEGRNVDHVAYRVRPWDGEAILAKLKSHGIEGQIKSRYGADGDGPSIFFKDPEGNGVELKGPPPPEGSVQTAG